MTSLPEYIEHLDVNDMLLLLRSAIECFMIGF